MPQESVEMVSAADENLAFHGLDGDVYYLKETAAPVGYRFLNKPIILSVTLQFTSEKNSYIKGNGATEGTLVSLSVSTHIESFYDGLLQIEEQSLNTDVEVGLIHLTVVNQIGEMLPIIGRPRLLILFLAGILLMSAAILASRPAKRHKSLRKDRR